MNIERGGEEGCLYARVRPELLYDSGNYSDCRRKKKERRGDKPDDFYVNLSRIQRLRGRRRKYPRVVAAVCSIQLAVPTTTGVRG